MSYEDKASGGKHDKLILSLFLLLLIACIFFSN